MYVVCTHDVFKLYVRFQERRKSPGRNRVFWIAYLERKCMFWVRGVML